MLPSCTGSDGEPVLRAFFDDLSNGSGDLVARYFVEPQQFVRWSDPAAGLITYLPGPGDATETLDALDDRLVSLQRQGAQLTVTDFAAVGFEGAGTPEAGGWFLFGLHGTPSSGVAVQDGTGKGAVDCRSNKIKALVIDAW